jgi:hypothetical protein
MDIPLARRMDIVRTVSLPRVFRNVEDAARLETEHAQILQLEALEGISNEAPVPVSSFPFLDLPAEIRTLVYEFMFVSECPIYPTRFRAGIYPFINLLRANRQIYAEAINTLYGENTFQIRGDPAFRSAEFLHFISEQRRHERLPRSSPDVAKVCLARCNLRRVNIPSHGISIDRLKHLFSLLKNFPKLQHVQVVYLPKRDILDIKIIELCRLFKDMAPIRLPELKEVRLLKRISFTEAEDISWTMYRPYYKWAPAPDEPASKHFWINPECPGVVRKAEVVIAPQKIPE